jgi:hypothetical protein
VVGTVIYGSRNLTVQEVQPNQSSIYILYITFVALKLMSGESPVGKKAKMSTKEIIASPLAPAAIGKCV